MSHSIGVIDLFAGPGGLGEGFASFRNNGNSPFEICLSVEKDSVANRTLKLRSFLRKYKDQHDILPQDYIDFYAGKTPEPDWNEVDRQSWREVQEEIIQLELGTKEASDRINSEIKRLKSKYDETVLIGGPPCQAYSLVGRVRSRSIKDYVPEKDNRQFLFRDYIKVIDKLRPAVFLMENVKGMLSSSIQNQKIFEMLVSNLVSLGTGNDHLYDLRSIAVSENHANLKESTKPSDYIIRSEEFGVPQRRHRIFIVGIRSDLSSGSSKARIEIDKKSRSVNDVIGNLDRLRSGINRGQDNFDDWYGNLRESALALSKLIKSKDNRELRELFLSTSKNSKKNTPSIRNSKELPQDYGNSNDRLLQWMERNELDTIAQHETRSHMGEDLRRYLFAACFGKVEGYSPKAKDFPLKLSPNHRSWRSGHFNDRFRVQLSDSASTTVTCHISKDGHYFIHPDPIQCRSITVREAARLQTFPDDYLFLGNRTQQYVQVGNAVPPYLARQIAHLVFQVFVDRSAK